MTPQWLHKYAKEIAPLILPSTLSVSVSIWDEDYSYAQNDYKYLRLMVKLYSTILEDSFENLTEHLIHEMCHYYTSSWREIMMSDKWLEAMIGKNNVIAMENRISDCEEHCTVHLERKFTDIVKKTQVYKKYKAISKLK